MAPKDEIQTKKKNKKKWSASLTECTLTHGSKVVWYA